MEPAGTAAVNEFARFGLGINRHSSTVTGARLARGVEMRERLLSLVRFSEQT
jgi:hypothetical protein